MSPLTTAEHLATAAMKIARANHYMVGFDIDTIMGISYADIQKAWNILAPHPAPRFNILVYDRAFDVLNRLSVRLYVEPLKRTKHP